MSNKYMIRLAGGAAIILAVTGMPSCTKNFNTININPDASSAVIPQYVFTKAEYDGAGNAQNGIYGGSGMNFLMGTMQYTTSYNDVLGFGSKYNANQVTQTYAAFAAAYPDEINELGIVIKAVKNNPSQVNLLAAARIWRVYCFSRLTDLYGDIPYFHAGQGYDSSIYKPTYDPQAAIYADMLSELDGAAKSFDAAKGTYGAADLIYNGNVAQWQKFAYSLMLRLGMRMTKVDIAAAQTWVTKAIAGGVITADADIAKMSYLGSGQVINQNPQAYDMWNADYHFQDGVSNPEGGKYQQSWIDSLKAHNDPRLPVISVVFINGSPDTTASKQVGMPATFVNAKPPNFGSYSEPNARTLLQFGSPKLLFTAAESYFLLTEAALRGWYTGDAADVLYASGIRAAMRQWSIIAGNAGTIATPQVDAYVTANALNMSATLDQQMAQLYTQFWFSIFPNATEAFASYRRTGYPALVPNNYAGNATGGKIFRRMLYPAAEQNLNAAAYAAAVAQQGANDLMTHIWWDK